MHPPAGPSAVADPVGGDPAFGGLPGLLLRPRLVDALARGLHRPLTVLSAPAGFGKTTALRQFLEVPGVLRRPGRRPGSAARAEAGLSAGVGLFETLGGALVVVLDQHGIPSGAGAAEWFEAALRAVRTGLAGRAPDPHIFVACRPGAGPCEGAASVPTALVIGESDLAFTAEEAGLLVEELTGRKLSGDHLAALMAWTEGWPVAVRLAAAAIRGGAGVDEAVRGGESVERYLGAFLRHEVLEHEPAGVRRFLARTSVLGGFDEQLCRVVDGRPDSGAALRRIERERLFIRRHPTMEGSYQYFRPVRELLRRELREQEPESESHLLTSAAVWLAAHDKPELAAPYLLEAEQWDDLVGLLDRTGPRFQRLGLLEDVVGWLEAVPVASPEGRSRVALRQLFALNLLGESGRAEQVSRALRRRDLSPGEQAVIDVLRAVGAAQDTRPSDAVDAARCALRALDARIGEIPPVLGMAERGDLIWMASTALAQALWQKGDLAPSCGVFSALMERTDGRLRVRSEAMAALALAEAWSGDHLTARSRAARVLGRHGGSHAVPAAPAGGTPEGGIPGEGAPGEAVPAAAALALAHALREEGDLAAAKRWLDRPEVEDRRSRSMLTAAVVAIERALWCLAVGRIGDGLQEIRLVELWSSGPLPPLLEGSLRSVEVRLELLQGDTARAESILGAVEAPWTPSLAGASVQSALAGNDMELALERLNEWPEVAGNRITDAEREMWTAVVDFDAGRRRQALRRLGRLLSAAEERGYVRLFLDGGPSVVRLLRSAARLAPGSYAAALASAAAVGSQNDASPAGLSPREREILRYLPTPLSSAQMAARLYISVNTLKTHLRTIYRKLGVSGRRDAIDRAKELGLA